MAQKQLHRQSISRIPKQGWSVANRYYLALARRFPIRPIRTHEELDQAIRMLNSLLRRTRPLDEQEQGYFDSLANEIHRYETIAVSIPKVSGPDMLSFLMEQKSASLSDVAKNTGIVVSTLSAILTKKRK